jgi:thioredoxin reductase/NAD-dependent dihydropyrimidine dehydrogenase PreA subunit
MSTTLLGLGVFALLALPFFVAARRRERRSEEAQVAAEAAGLHQPVSLHPVIDTDRCIGSGGCVSVCPEDVIGFREGQAFALAPARCIGHGLCERVCPVGAIRLVIGTESRGVELPRLGDDFETNVPGVHVIGELGGMGLIRNAFEQGRECVAAIARRLEPVPGDVLDVVIVGAGPAGLAATLHAHQRGLRYVTVEKEDVGGTVRYYPRRKLVMSERLQLPGYGQLEAREILKERLVEVWEDIVARSGVRIRTRETVLAVRREADGTLLVTTDRDTLRAVHVILAIGRRGVPRKLGVPGEERSNVAYALLDPEPFAGEPVLVVGGGDAAAEAALALAAQPATRVWLSYRGAALTRVKPRNRARCEAAFEAGSITPLLQTQVSVIEPGGVRLTDAAGSDVAIPATRVFIFAGGELPTPFLQACGIELETKFGTPLRAGGYGKRARA